MNKNALKAVLKIWINIFIGLIYFLLLLYTSTYFDSPYPILIGVFGPVIIIINYILYINALAYEDFKGKRDR